MTRTTFITASALVLCSTATLCCSVPAEAADGGSSQAAPLKYAVRFQDLDLSRMEHVTTLYGRLLQAARALCEPSRSPGMTVSAEPAAEAASCVDKAIDDAVTRINRPLLTQYRRSRAGDARRAQLAQTR
jgi:UrcA family protein